MRTEQAALEKACSLSKKRNRDYYVVFEDDCFDGTGPYHVASDFDLDEGIFSCSQVIHTIENGEPVSY